jgi:hypothetical protein
MVCGWVLYPRTGYNLKQHFKTFNEMLLFLCYFLASFAYLHKIKVHLLKVTTTVTTTA